MLPTPPNQEDKREEQEHARLLHRIQHELKTIKVGCAEESRKSLNLAESFGLRLPER